MMMNSASDYTICNLDSQTYTTGYGGGASSGTAGSGRDSLSGPVPHGGVASTYSAGGCGYSRTVNGESTRNGIIVDGQSMYGLPATECQSSRNMVSGSPPGLGVNPRAIEEAPGLGFRASPVVSSPSLNDRQSNDEHLHPDQQPSRTGARSHNGSSNGSSSSINGHVGYGGPMSPVSYPIQPPVSTCAATTPPGYDAYYDVNPASAAGHNAGNLSAAALNAANALCAAGGGPGGYPYPHQETEIVDLLQTHNGYHPTNGTIAGMGNVTPPLLHHPQLHQGHSPLTGHNLSNPQHNLHPSMSHPHGGHHQLGTPPQMHHSPPGCGISNNGTNLTNGNVLTSSQHHNHQQTSLSHQQSSADNGVATYKWMTVKRGNTSKCKLAKITLNITNNFKCIFVANIGFCSLILYKDTRKLHCKIKYVNFIPTSAKQISKQMLSSATLASY